jgi:hypothetical protein
MRDALLAASSQRKIHFNLCNWGRDSVWTWGGTYGHSWRYAALLRFSFPPLTKSQHVRG